MDIDEVHMQGTIRLIGAVLAALCFRGYASDAPPPMLRVRERSVFPVSPPMPCELGTKQVARYFNLAVYSTRQLVYERSDYTFCPQPDPQFHARWEAPDGRKETFRFVMPPQEFNELMAFVEQWGGRIESFFNAAPISDDFEITIARPSGPELISVIAFMPNHVDLVTSPALVHLICRAKKLARSASGAGEIPKYCENLRPLTNDSPGRVPK
jgi:hypothetical protein